MIKIELGLVLLVMIPQAVESGFKHWNQIRNWLDRRKIAKRSK
jgi:hypothetical protein